MKWSPYSVFLKTFFMMYKSKKLKQKLGMPVGDHFIIFTLYFIIFLRPSFNYFSTLPLNQVLFKSLLYESILHKGWHFLRILFKTNMSSMQNKPVIYLLKNKIVKWSPWSFSKTPPPPKWSPDHFFYFFIFAPFPNLLNS